MRGRQPRVVILVENLPVPLDRRVWWEATTLRDAGWRVVVIGPRGDGAMRKLRQRVDGIDILRYPQRPASGLLGYILEYPPSLLLSLMWLIYTRATGRIDVVHGCNPPDLFFALGLIGRGFGARFVYDQHDPNPELSASKFGSRSVKARLLYRLMILLEAASYRCADVVLTVNDTCRDLALARGRLAPERVFVVRNTSDVDRMRRLAGDAQPHGRRVGYIGVMGTHDGLDVLADAWLLVKQQPDMADVALDLVGDGPARQSTEARLRRLGDSVRFHGYQQPEAFAPILAQCLVGVCPDPPTPFNDLSSMVKVMDYMAVGRGSVCFDLRETRRLGGDSLKVARAPDARGLADALIEVLRDRELADTLGVHARRRVEELKQTWVSNDRTLLQAYAQVMRHSPRAGTAGDLA